ncbi:MAG TPA: hypothetical protein VJ483_09780 [Holophagaceae bacterium]|nr:hypothetical protein [Holophagaceae bacterium]
MVPPDPQVPDSLRAAIDAWLRGRSQSVLEELMAACQASLERMSPDSAMWAQVAAALPHQGGGAEALLGEALDALDAARTQSEALQRLLDGLAPLASRCALYVLKQEMPSLYGWRGFEGETPKGGAPIIPPPDLVDLIQGRLAMIREGGPSYWALLAPLSPLKAPDVRIMPIRIRRRTVALVMFDSGMQPAIAHADSARAYVMACAAALGVIAAQSAEGTGATTMTMELPASMPTQPVPAPPPAPKPRPPAPQIPALERTNPGLAMPSAPAPPHPPPAAAMPTPPAAGDLDPKTRAAAERLARVLVGDIELYFPAKVEQAKAQGNLYGLLREELERSRHNFVERFGEEVELKFAIFRQTVVGQLCDGDPAKLGKAPWA